MRFVARKTTLLQDTPSSLFCGKSCPLCVVGFSRLRTMHISDVVSVGIEKQAQPHANDRNTFSNGLCPVKCDFGKKCSILALGTVGVALSRHSLGNWSGRGPERPMHQGHGQGPVALGRAQRGSRSRSALSLVGSCQAAKRLSQR